MFLCDWLGWTRTIILVEVRLKITMFVGRMMGSRQRRVRWGESMLFRDEGPYIIDLVRSVICHSLEAEDPFTPRYRCDRAS